MERKLTKGWRADINTSRLGYFRTDDETVDRVLSHLSFSEEGCVLFDPCCGEGLALSRIQQSAGANAKSYGIELDAERFKAASLCLSDVLHGDAIDDHYGSGKWAGLLFFNPPYGDVENDKEETTRLELLFWRAHSDRLAKGGLLVAVLPTQLFLRQPQMAKFMGHYLGQDARIYRASTDQFNQLVILGTRNSQSHRFDTLLAQTLIAVSEGSAEVPVIPYLPAPIYSVVEGHEPQTFSMTRLTDESLDMLFEQSDQESFLVSVHKALQKTHEKPRQRSIMPLRDGHVPAVLASGLLDGIVEDEHGRYLVKGSVRRAATKKQAVSQGETKATITTTTILHAETSCFAWDLDRHTLLEIS